MEKNREPGNKSLNACGQLTATLWTGACQAPLSVGFSRQEYWSEKKKKKEYWSELPCCLPGDLPDPVIKSTSPALQVDSLLTEPPGKL